MVLEVGEGSHHRILHCCKIPVWKEKKRAKVTNGRVESKKRIKAHRWLDQVMKGQKIWLLRE